MQTPGNPFKQALVEKRLQIGLWTGLATAYCTEICAGAGFDWLALDCEHAPNHTRSILAQMQAMAGYAAHPVVRTASSDATHIKHLLDLGAQTLVVPVVETPEQAAQLVRATRYPPEGIRGVGAALARASRWNQMTDYLQAADEHICLIAQIETRAGVAQAAQIAAVPGIDGVLIGPADLSASLGHRGDPDHPQVQEAMQSVVKQALAAGKAVGSLLSDEAMARRYIDLGCTFMAVGVDVSLLAGAARSLAQRYR
ncbi:MAG: 2-dehydro-3-deoxyglucarate aldolase [Nevskiaceae bacterium]|jgi:4-hydroxy-2-oxoheptanedioate aldolase|nr:2-dehydro-3-deoxyglucarate aldolase [Nevskiaceae bacterium]